MPITPVLEKDIVLDNFICTVHATVSAVTHDTDLVKVNRFKLYLLTAVVPVMTLSSGLGLEPDQHVDTIGTSSAVCQRILTDIIQKVKFLQDLLKSQRVLALLNRFITEKLDNIQSKLEGYLQMTDYYSTACQYEC